MNDSMFYICVKKLRLPMKHGLLSVNISYVFSVCKVSDLTTNNGLENKTNSQKLLCMLYMLSYNIYSLSTFLETFTPAYSCFLSMNIQQCIKS